MKLPEPPEYAEFLAPYPATTQELSRELRRRLVALLPDCIETIWDATNTVSVAYGFTEKNSDHFIHLPTYTKYVNIGFSQGTSLNDPEGRLQGQGTRIRHIRLSKAEDLDDPYLRDLIQQAWAGANHAGSHVVPRTIVRVMDGPKRRPNSQARVSVPLSVPRPKSAPFWRLHDLGTSRPTGRHSVAQNHLALEPREEVGHDEVGGHPIGKPLHAEYGPKHRVRVRTGHPKP